MLLLPKNTSHANFSAFCSLVAGSFKMPETFGKEGNYVGPNYKKSMVGHFPILRVSTEGNLIKKLEKIIEGNLTVI